MNILQLAQAGAIVAEPDSKLDTVSAREYRHRALGDRAVVRLVSDSLGTAEDLTLEFHGFSLHKTQPVGYQLRKGLGFPGWALIHDPERAALALEVLKQFRAQAKLARSRPGAAKEGFDEIAERLGRSVPHFLPSFYEEAGRVFLDNANAKMAQTMFGKARQAEKVHALKVDESLRREAFLEFALAGAVSIKTLSEYAKELSDEHDPEQAYLHFRELCLRRTLGGMPPWSGMLKELKRLAKAAGKNVKQEEHALLAEVLSAPAVSRAPIEFWNSAKETVTQLCQERPELRKTLLHLFPIFSGDRLKQGGAWLELLEHWGAISVLESEPNCAAWFSRMLGHFYHWSSASPNPDQLFSLVRRAAPTLQTQGLTVTIKDVWRADLDLLELLASLQIPIALDNKFPRAELHLSGWASGSGPERPRDPVNLSQLPDLQPLLLRSLDRYFGSEPFTSVSRSMQGWKNLKRIWLQAQVEELETGALPALSSTLDRWEQAANSQILADYPELRGRLRKLDRQALLARTLRGFVPDELSWPALEKALEELGEQATVNGMFPYAVVTNGLRAIAVGHDGERARHELKLPPGTKLETAVYIDGEFLLLTWDGSVRKAVWSRGKECEFSYFYRGFSSLRCAELPGVGLTFGERAVRAGDPSLASGRTGRLVCDKTTCWRLEGTPKETFLREFDPRTGSDGRRSWPEFFENWIEPESQLETRTCELFPLPLGLETSPLGAKDGLAGWRVRQRGNVWQGETLAGQSYQANKAFAGIVTIDGAERLIEAGYRTSAVLCNGVTVADMRTTPQAALWRLEPHWWHLFQPRKVEDSRRLRAVSDDRADSLKLESPQLQKAHQGLLEESQQLFARLQSFLVEPEDAGLVSVSTEQLKELIASFALQLYGSQSLSEEAKAIASLLPRATQPEGLLAKLGRVFSRTSSSAAPLFAPIPFPFSQNYLPHIGALAWRLVTPWADPNELESGLTLLAWWADSPLLKEPQKFRRLWLKLPEYDSHIVTLAQGNSRYLLAPAYSEQVIHQGFEATTDGSFRLPKGATLERSEPCQPGWGTPERLLKFIAAARAHGRLPWKREHAERLSEITGLSYPESCLLWAGFPGFHEWRSSFLSSEIREAMGLKSAEAKLARDNLRGLEAERRLELFSQAMPDDPAWLWSNTEACVERLGEVWNRLQGARLSISNELLKALSSLSYVKPAEFLPAFTEPSKGVFNRDGRSEPTGWRVEVDPPDSFEQHHLALALSYLAYFFEYLPVGDPLRQTAVKAWPFIEQRLKNPHLLFHARNLEPGAKETAEQWRAMLGGTDNGRVLMQTGPWGDSSFYYRPATVEPDDPILKALGASDWEALQAVKRPEFAEFIKRFSQTPVPKGGYETNPTLSAPELVAQVQEKLELCQNEAVLYLQTLALLQPTAKNIQLWNSWTAAVYKKTAAALTERGLLLQAKRSRAGRAHFLPGGWVEQKAPYLPFESWKASSYGVSPQTRLKPGQFFILAPSHRLFQHAWQRVTSGDAPAYEEMKGS